MGTERRTRVKLAVAALLLAVVAGVAAAVPLRGRGGSQPRPAAPIAPVGGVQAVESSSPVQDASGAWWTPDRFAHGGGLLTSRVPIAYTHAPALYQSQRVGVRSIDVPLHQDGTYLVVLYLAELAAAAGGRTFEVLAQGQPVATVDVARDVGPLAPYHLAFTAAVRRHALRIRFRALRGEPILSALRVTRVASTIEVPARRSVWSDEFDGPRGARPDPSHWGFDVGRGWGQAALYTDAAANASLDGRGDLVLTARAPASASARELAGSVPLDSIGITSARITTQGLFAMRFGAASARLRVADRPGVVSTFWALGSDVDRVRWPRSGEIDPLEVRGLEPRVLVQALHMPCGSRPCPVVWAHAVGASLAAGFHTITVERAPGVVVYLLDGRQVASLTDADVSRGAWVFDKPFFLVLNLIVGGWGGRPTAATGWPITMSIDWVRAYG